MYLDYLIVQSRRNQAICAPHVGQVFNYLRERVREHGIKIKNYLQWLHVVARSLSYKHSSTDREERGMQRSGVIEELERALPT